MSVASLAQISAITSEQMTAAEARVLRADAARVRAQRAEQDPAVRVTTAARKPVAA